MRYDLWKYGYVRTQEWRNPGSKFCDRFYANSLVTTIFNWDITMKFGMCSKVYMMNISRKNQTEIIGFNDFRL